MPFVLTTSSQLVCPHQGTIKVTASQHALTVAGQPVLVRGDLVGAPVSGCTHTNVNAGEIQCLAILGIEDGVAQKLTAGGQPVMLATATGTTNSEDSASAKWSVSSVNQSTMEAL